MYDEGYALPVLDDANMHHRWHDLNALSPGIGPGLRLYGAHASHCGAGRSDDLVRLGTALHSHSSGRHNHSAAPVPWRNIGWLAAGIPVVYSAIIQSPAVEFLRGRKRQIKRLHGNGHNPASTV